MNLLAWVFCLSLLIALMIKAVAFQRATVCRQEAWLKSTEAVTRTLLTNPPATDQDFHAGCRLFINRKGNQVSWRALPNLKSHHFNIPVAGTL